MKLTLRSGSKLALLLPSYNGRRKRIIFKRNGSGLVDLIMPVSCSNIPIYLRGKGVRSVRRSYGVGRYLKDVRLQKGVSLTARWDRWTYTVIKVGRKTILVKLWANNFGFSKASIEMPQGSVLRKIVGRGIRKRYEQFVDKCRHKNMPRMSSYYEDFGFSDPVKCPDCGYKCGI